MMLRKFEIERRMVVIVSEYLLAVVREPSIAINVET